MWLKNNTVAKETAFWPPWHTDIQRWRTYRLLDSPLRHFLVVVAVDVLEKRVKRLLCSSSWGGYRSCSLNIRIGGVGTGNVEGSKRRKKLSWMMVVVLTAGWPENCLNCTLKKSPKMSPDILKYFEKKNCKMFFDRRNIWNLNHAWYKKSRIFLKSKIFH